MVERGTEHEIDQSIVDRIRAERDKFRDAFYSYWQAFYPYNKAMIRSNRVQSDARFGNRSLTVEEENVVSRAAKLKEIEAWFDKKLKIASQARIELVTLLSRNAITQAKWSSLTAFERRVLDVAAANQIELLLGGDDCLRPFAAELVLEALAMGCSTSEQACLRESIGDDLRTVISLRHLFLNPLMVSSSAIYGGRVIADVADYGASIFGLQRSLSQLSDFFLPKLLHFIPTGYTINRGAVVSYFSEVLARSRAHFISTDGIEMTINPHLCEPYTDQEWQMVLEKQLKAAPRIAHELADSCPGLVAVTLYGPLTRADKDYVMFHPNQGIQLGACFSDRKAVVQAVRVVEHLSLKYGVKVKTGTGHVGSLSGWVYFTQSKLEQLRSELTQSPDRIFYDLDQLGEAYSQIVNGVPLAVNKPGRFQYFRRFISAMADRYLLPVFDRVEQLQKHFEAGYPYPFEN